MRQAVRLRWSRSRLRFMIFRRNFRHNLASSLHRLARWIDSDKSNHPVPASRHRERAVGERHTWR